MKLRYYQTDLINDARKSLRTHKHILCVLPCRAGKTVCFAYMAHNHVLRGGKVWFLVHRRELVNQAKETFKRLNLPLDSIYIGMVGTALKKASFEPSMIIFDEAHHSSANTWRKIIDTYPNAYVIGLTATPARLDGKPLGDIYEDLIEGPDANTLIEQNYISNYKYYAPDLNLDNSKWVIKGGDYDMNSVSTSIDKPAIYGEVSKIINNEHKYIIYCPSVEYSRKLAKSLNAAHIDAETPEIERNYIMNEFANGKINILCNCMLFGEGIDVPDCDTVIMLRPTLSLSLYIQQAMRCMTYKPNKTAYVYDLVGNVFKHGLPTDKQEWSLNAQIKHRSNNTDVETFVRECKNCFLVYDSKKYGSQCPYCGHDNGATKQELKIKAEAELKEIEKLEKRKQRREQGMAQSMSELIDLAIKRGYKNPRGWAYMVMKSRKII